MSEILEITSRFHKSRWSDERKKLYAMNIGDTLTFPITSYYNVHSSVMRLSDAYEDKKWTMRRNRKFIWVTCGRRDESARID